MANVPFTRERARDHTTRLIAGYLGLTLETAGRVTDLNVGSVTRCLFESIALRLEALDSKTFWALERAIPLVLYDFFGEGDGVTTTVGFPKLGPVTATTLVRFARQVGTVGDVAIPAGTRLTVPAAGATPAKVYLTTAAAVLPAASTTVDVMVRADRAGVSGNTPAATMVLTDGVAGIVAATNPAAVVNGAAEESDDARRQRFAAYLLNLARAQARGLDEVGALTAKLVTLGVVTERVVVARAVEPPDYRGLVYLYIDNGGGTASPALVAEAQQVIDGRRAIDGHRIAGYKAAGIVVVVRPVTPQVVPVDVQIALDPGFAFAEVQAATASAVTAFVTGLGVFTDLVLADLICAIAGVRGVHDVRVVSPIANVVAGDGARLVVGTVTVTEGITTP